MNNLLKNQFGPFDLPLGHHDEIFFFKAACFNNQLSDCKKKSTRYFYCNY